MKLDDDEIQRLWDAARPYYEHGRSMDVAHIRWLIMAGRLVAAQEDLDQAIFLPLLILHDVGYAKVDAMDPFLPESRRQHMQAGAEIARDLLRGLHMSEQRLDTICHYISVHDNWALGEDSIFREDVILGAFNDLDFSWMATPMGFAVVGQLLHTSPTEMLVFLEGNEKHMRRPFATGSTRRIFHHLLDNRRKGLKNSGIDPVGTTRFKEAEPRVNQGQTRQG